MSDIIGTIIIMLFCITALAQQGKTDDTVYLPKPKNKAKPDPLKADKPGRDA